RCSGQPWEPPNGICRSTHSRSYPFISRQRLWMVTRTLPRPSSSVCRRIPSPIVFLFGIRYHPPIPFSQSGSMRVAAILKQWIEVLAAVVFGWRELWRGRRSLIVSRDEGRFIVRQVQSGRESILVTAEMGSKVSEAVARIVRKSFVIFEFPLDTIVLRRISVPAQAREYLSGIVGNQIERLSPWQADQSVYGFDAEVSQEDATALNVRVLIAARPDIEGARDEIAAIGLPVDRVVAGAGAAQATAPVTLWS